MRLKLMRSEVTVHLTQSVNIEPLDCGACEYYKVCHIAEVYSRQDARRCQILSLFSEFQCLCSVSAGLRGMYLLGCVLLERGDTPSLLSQHAFEPCRQDHSANTFLPCSTHQ